MSKCICFLAALFFFPGVYSQPLVKLEDAKDHIGDSVTVCGKVADAAFVEEMQDSPTFLNLGAPYPDQLLNLVILIDERIKYDPAPEIFYISKNVCATGKIELIDNFPEIVIRDRRQIRITN